MNPSIYQIRNRKHVATRDHLARGGFVHVIECMDPMEESSAEETVGPSPPDETESSAQNIGLDCARGSGRCMSAETEAPHDL